MKELGNLKRIDPREIWESEPKDFTRWLKTNIEKLAETIGLEIDITEQESPVGSFAADLIGRDLNSDRVVVIENQLEETDHDHLGKLLTYAAGKEAKIVVWISPQFRDEHQQALEWLNELSNEQTSFFGVEVEILQIDEGKPAADFKIVAKPNWWQKSQAAPPVSEKQQKYQEFFSDLLNELKLRKPGITHASKASPANWFSFAAGKSGFYYSFSFAQNNRFRVELYIDTGYKEISKKVFDIFVQQKNEIEQELGAPVSWERLDEKSACRIATYHEGKIEDTSQSLYALKIWAVEMMTKFHQSFSPRIARLNLPKPKINHE